MNYLIKTLDNSYQQNILDLILPIQQIEFNVPVTLEGQPDLLDIESFYLKGGGNFWGAFEGDKLVGTIAMIDTGYQACAIRKMFVKKEYRGKEFGIAQHLFDMLKAYCLEHDIKKIFLGTVDMLKAAHRFYEKNGFTRIKPEDLPDYFPAMMGENVYYYLYIGKD